MPIFGKASSSSLAAVHRGAAGGSVSGLSDFDGPRRSSFSATLHAAAAATAGDEDAGAAAAGEDPLQLDNGRLREHHDDSNDDHDNDATETDPLLEATGTDGIDLIKTVEKQSVYPILHYVRRLILNTIDTALSWEELTSVDLNFAIVRPLAHRLSRLKSIAIVNVLLLNKIQFGYDADKDLAYQQVNNTRAMLCELLAIKMLRTFSRDGIELVTALTAPFSPFAGADEGAITDLFLSRASSTSKHKHASASGSGSSSHPAAAAAVSGSSFFYPDRKRPRSGGRASSSGARSISALYTNTKSSALELAISGRATKFLASPLARRCVDGIWTGRVVISSHASHAIIEDSYKKRPLSIYDPSRAPILDHYRLRVPLIRNRLEFLNFVVLLVVFLIALGQRGTPHWTVPETIFTIWLAGFTLDEFAQMQEHGLGIYFGSLDNGLDALFITISTFFLAFRISGLLHADFSQQELAFDCLALGAIVLCPRVASIFVADSVVLLSLKAMLADFLFFMSLAMVCFSGFWLTFWSLVEDRVTWTPGSILWIMLRICFFAGYVDLSVAKTFSPIFGPPLFVFFAVVSNVMLLTILISSLSNTFTVVAMRADEETAYYHACKSLGGISSDAIFSYIPPLNLVGFAVILPCKFFLNERYVHKVHVFLVRSLSFPILLTIRLLERQAFKNGLELTAERGRRAFSWIPLIGSSRGREEREVLAMVFSHESSALTTDVDAFGGLLSGTAGVGGGPGGSAIYSPQASAIGSARQSSHPDDDDDDDDEAAIGKLGGDRVDTRQDVGAAYLDQVIGKVIQEGEAREALVATLKEQARGDVAVAKAFEGEESQGKDGPDPPPSSGPDAADRRRSQYGQHLTPDGLPREGNVAQTRGGSSTSTNLGLPTQSDDTRSASAAENSSGRNLKLPRSRTRTTTMSSHRSGAISIPLIPAEEGGPSSPPPRGLGSLTNPLARFFGGTGGHMPSGRRAQRVAPQPSIQEQGVTESSAVGAGAGRPVGSGPSPGHPDPSFGFNTFGAPTASPGTAVEGGTKEPSATEAGRTSLDVESIRADAGAGAGAGVTNAPASPSGRAPHPQKHGLEDSPAARALLKRMDKLEKSNEVMLELLRSLVAASSTRD